MLNSNFANLSQKLNSVPEVIEKVRTATTFQVPSSQKESGLIPREGDGSLAVMHKRQLWHLEVRSKLVRSGVLFFLQLTDIIIPCLGLWEVEQCWSYFAQPTTFIVILESMYKYWQQGREVSLTPYLKMLTRSIGEWPLTCHWLTPLGPPFMACMWLRECCRQINAEMVSNSKNKLHQTM